MVGNAVATIVWLRAARKTVSMRPTNIVRASAGFSARGFSVAGAPVSFARHTTSRTGETGFASERVNFTRNASRLRRRKPARIGNAGISLATPAPAREPGGKDRGRDARATIRSYGTPG